MMFNKILKSKQAEGSISTAIKVMISVVLGGLVLLGTISLIDTNIGPALNNTLNTQQDEEVTNPVSLTHSVEVAIGRGDVNQDGVVNENDVEYLNRYLNGWEGYGWNEFSGGFLPVVDLNEDSEINFEDLDILKQMVLSNSLIHSGIIPYGATYTVVSTGEVLEAGDFFPEVCLDKDIYRYGDYTYIYNGYIDAGAPVPIPIEEKTNSKDINGWNVTVEENMGKTVYGTILETINNKNVTGMINTFYRSSNLITESPKIPDTVVYMENAFGFCRQLSEIPEIPEGVVDMQGTFSQIDKTFEQDVTLPKTVVNIRSAFWNCGFSGVLRVPCTANSPEDKGSIFGDYSDSQTVEVYHYEGCGHVLSSSELSHSDVIPYGATYTVVSTGETLTEGDSFPAINQDGDIYRYGDYTYIYNGYVSTITSVPIEQKITLKNINGWNVTIEENPNKTSYGVILKAINNKNVTGMINAFYTGSQTNFVEPPKIPDTVIYMDNAFLACTQLSKIPEIPEGVINMSSAFAQINKTFEQDVTLPKTVVDVRSAFYNCGINGVLKVPCTANSIEDKFSLFGPYSDSVTIEVYHYEGCGHVLPSSELSHSDVIPYGATYTVVSTGETLTEGDSFPITNQDGDIYKYGDYIYIYNGYISSTASVPVEEKTTLKNINGWNVNVEYSSKTSYGVILETINNKNVTGMINTFYVTPHTIVESPKIPDTVVYMECAFEFCSQLSEIPEIPEGVIDMQGTFAQIDKTFEQDVTLPKTVVNIRSAFYNCGFSGVIRVPCTANSPEDKDSIFGPYSDSQTVEVYHYEGCGH